MQTSLTAEVPATNDRRNVRGLTVHRELKGGGRAERAVVMRSLLFLAVMALLLASVGCNVGSSKPTTARAASSGQPNPESVATAEQRDLQYYITGLGCVPAFIIESLQ